MNAQSKAAKKLRLDLEQSKKKNWKKIQNWNVLNTEGAAEFWQGVVVAVVGEGGEGGRIHDNKESLLDFLFGKVPSNDWGQKGNASQ